MTHTFAFSLHAWSWEVQATTAAVYLRLMETGRRRGLKASNRDTEQLHCPSEGGYREEQSWVVAGGKSLKLS